MKIELMQIIVKEITDDYEDNEENGVFGFGKKLNIRPPFQREFVYNDKQRDAVIDTVTKGFPLNVMYWSKNDDGNFEVIDGQQRTVSLCQYVASDFSIDGLAFHNLQKDKQDQILNYPLMIYVCSGTDSEKLEWFKTINIAGEELSDQELRNAVYSGSWVSDAKRYFSKINRPKLGDDYLTGSANRQEYLETAIDWISEKNIEKYMSNHQHDKDAEELWKYFERVITWVKTIFIKYRKEMRGVEFGLLYNKFKHKKHDAKKLEEEIETLMEDDEVTNKKGIYYYIFTEKENNLNIRSFTEKQKREKYEKQKGICIACSNHFEIEEMDADHITPWSKGGKTIIENCQLLCKEDNRRKAGK